MVRLAWLARSVLCLLLGACIASPPPQSILDDLAAIEARSGGRLGVALIDSDGTLRAGYRSAERFAMCSTFKLPLAAMVLDRVGSGAMTLDQPLNVTKAEMVAYSPYVEAQLAMVPPAPVTVGAAAGAAVSLSDNTAANLLLDQMGGPDGFTAWLRSKGDMVTRLDRREPALNENLFGDPSDTTSPLAIARTTRVLVTGDGLAAAQQKTLFGWMKATSTGLQRIRGGLPPTWVAGDKTGSCGNAFNDIAVFTTDANRTYTLAIYLDRPAVKGEQANAIIADATRIVLSHVR